MRSPTPPQAVHAPPARSAQSRARSPQAASTITIYLQRDFRLRAGIEVGVALEPLELRFAGERVASFGQPWFGASLGAEWLYSRR